VDDRDLSLSQLNEQDQPLASISLNELACVGLGGALGVGSRYLVSQHFPSTLLGHGTFGFVTPLLFINTFGAFMLGLLLSRFVEHPRHQLRLLLTTGVLGGFTSYGALADTTRQQIVEHMGSATVLSGLGVALLFGLGAVTLGQFLGRHLNSVTDS